MAAPLAAVPWLIGAGKGLLGMAAKGGSAKLAGAAAGAGARRMAGTKLAGLASKIGGNGAKQLAIDFKDGAVRTGLNMTDGASRLEKIKRGLTSVEGFKKNIGIPMSGQDLAFAVGPDVLFGGIAAATTEGDIVDKALAGAGSAAGGVVGGLGLRGALGPKSGLGIMGTELIGGMVGDQVGYGAANKLIAAKNGGQTPAEQRMMAEQQQYEEQLRSQMYDQFLAENGLG